MLRSSTRLTGRSIARILAGILCASLAVVFFVATSTTPAAVADEIQDLQTKIKDRNSQIDQIQKEIEAYQKQIEATGKQSATLSNKIKQLQLTQNKLRADIKLTETQISSAQLKITALNKDITAKQLNINSNTLAMAEMMRKIQANDSQSLVENLLNGATLSDVVDQVEKIVEIQSQVREKIATLKDLKTKLAEDQNKTEAQKKELLAYQSNLLDQNKLVDQNKQQTNTLLVKTKNQESEYKKLLEQKKALRAAFEKELNAYQSELKLKIDPASIPSAGAGVLAWPTTNVRITQYFGNTDFSRAHAQVYNGNGHNGIDLAAAIGTPLKSAAAGTILGTGDTDLTCAGASFGRWVLIQHTNGLTTLYAHLSVIKVSKGQNVASGEVIGLSGETGYATGPHLHFTVYASQGVQIKTLKSKVCKGSYTMPIADIRAYLNPMLYLPAP